MLYSKDEIHKKCIIAASESPCKKRKVGAVLTSPSASPDGIMYNILSIGYNSSPTGICEDSNGVTTDDVIHAEVNCLINYDVYYSLGDISERYTNGLIMFVTHEPCNGCQAALLKHKIHYEVVGEFMKFDKTKLRMSLVPSSLSQACARALQYGARKYKVDNWRKTPDIESYISAMQRHFDAWREGEENDKESGLCHLDHMAANLAFLIELKHLPKLKQE